ncbi:metalloregulator ArsR/SmtB family transcription factor [Zavarzinia compransoris]|uniref:ArsR/SmtB family transcription factor n=1 Tax=Zavarzinia marina TaxID=2911065 RepID=UPI001F1D4AF6|nr:metalloregulator ArsR/SmtB family transcription factor [Zavarzinia marina]MCF4165879.1 metalloregulator ArsR/SmtB family transcription factor [Zavarzinia marina]
MAQAELMDMADHAADFLKVLANANRLMIVCHLLSGERSVSDLESELGIRQPTLSQQLGILREAGIVAGRRDAKSVIYHLADERARPMIAVMNNLFCGGPPVDDAHLDAGTKGVPTAAALSLPAARAAAPGEAAAFPTVRRPSRPSAE